MEKQLPKNWVECSLSDVFEIVTGNTPSKSFPEYYGGNIPWVKPGDINKSTEIYNTEEFLSEEGFDKSRKIPKGSVMVTCIGNLGNVAIAGTELATNQQINTIVIPHGFINKKYVYYRSLTFKKWLVENSTSTTIAMVNKSNFEKLIFLLPPLSEQNRIVEKLDRLFAQLEIIKSSMANIPLLLKDFRQQVLTQAVTGKLTEEWRKGKELEIVDVNTELNSNYLLHSIPEKWKHSVVGNIGKVKGGKRLPKGHELVIENTGLPYIRARDLKKGTVLTDKLMFLKPETQIQIKNYIVNKGDLYITIVGAKIGDAGVVPAKMHAANLTENAAKITDLNDFVFNEYVSIWLRGTICQSNIQETIMSAAQGKLALTRISQLPIYLPPLQEQQEIVYRVESLFAKADAIEQQYKTLKACIDNLPQALLHKAFKGELSEQLDSDGDARELLKEIQELKNNTVKPKKATTKKVKNYAENDEVLGMVAEENQKIRL